MVDSVRSILVLRSAALGDFILACPALAMLRKTYPTHRIVLLTLQSAGKSQREKVAAYAGGTGRVPWVELAMPHLVDEVMVMDGVPSLKRLAQMRAALRSMQFDRAVLLLDPAAPWAGRLKKLALILLLAGLIPVLGWRGKGSLNGDKSKLHRTGVLRHHIHGPLQFLAELRPPRPYGAEEIEFDLRPAAADWIWAKEWLHGVPGRMLVAMAPGSVQPHKRWPLVHFERLCGRLLSQYPGLAVVIIGTPQDESLGAALSGVDPLRVINMAGKTTIGQSAALLAHCELLVGNDGGGVHLADAMGCRVVSIVPGIEYPDSIEPWNNKRFAVREPVACAPCYNFTRCPQGHNRCMTAITVEAVFEKCREALEISN